MKICQICGKECKTKLGRHVIDAHHISIKQYYDEYLKQPNDGICPICGKETKFVRNYYKKCCCQSHAALYRQAQHNHNEKVIEFENANNCTNIVKLRQMYGQGWYKAKIVDYIESNFYTKMFYVKNSDISKIEEYCKLHKNSGKSYLEKQIVKFLKDNEVKVVENNKTLIYPKELDIYLPEYNTAIEFNGTWYHSIEAGCSKDYHLQKSLLCREKGIRLIHIYEFEDLDEQLKFLKAYLNNNDLYNDFNKNNFLDPIPKPELICISSRGYHIYGAGKLERSYL